MPKSHPIPFTRPVSRLSLLALFPRAQYEPDGEEMERRQWLGRGWEKSLLGRLVISACGLFKK